MLKRFACLAVVFCLPHLAYGQEDLKKLQGTWVLDGLEVNGARVAIDRLDGTTTVIKDDLYTVTIKNDTKFVMQIRLDEKKDPRELDMIAQDGANKDKVHKAIYQIKDGLFTVVRGLNPDQARPRDFATSANTGYFMATWKKKE